MTGHLPKVAAAVALALAASGAQARDFSDIFSVRGYGTLGVVYSDQDQADYVSTSTQPEGAGYTDDLSFAVDSRTALQIDAHFTERFSAVVQLISEGVYNNTWDGDPNEEFEPSLEWANIAYRLTDDVTLRGGRIVLPFLMVSEYRKVGYANHWLRPPVEMYGAIPFTTSDGGEISWQRPLAGGYNTLRVHYGEQTLRGGEVNAQSEIRGVNNSYEIGALTVRAAWMRAEFVALDSFAALFDNFAALASSLPGGVGVEAAQEAIRLRSTYNPGEQQRVDVYDIGATYDAGDWFVLAEGMHIDSDGIVPSSKGAYVSGGLRWRTLTPYLTYSIRDHEERSESLIPAISPALIPAPLQGPVLGMRAAANGIINGIVSGDSSQYSVSAGVRWDFYKSFALKFQYDYVHPEESGAFVNVQPGFEAGEPVNVFGLAVDFVF